MTPPFHDKTAGGSIIISSFLIILPVGGTVFDGDYYLIVKSFIRQTAVVYVYIHSQYEVTHTDKKRQQQEQNNKNTPFGHIGQHSQHSQYACRHNYSLVSAESTAANEEKTGRRLTSVPTKKRQHKRPACLPAYIYVYVYTYIT